MQMPVGSVVLTRSLTQTMLKATCVLFHQKQQVMKVGV